MLAETVRCFMGKHRTRPDVKGRVLLEGAVASAAVRSPLRASMDHIWRKPTVAECLVAQEAVGSSCKAEISCISYSKITGGRACSAHFSIHLKLEMN